MPPQMKIGQVYRVTDKVYDLIGSDTFVFFHFKDGILCNDEEIGLESVRLKRGEVALAIEKTIGPIPCTGRLLYPETVGMIFLTQNCDTFWVRVDLYDDGDNIFEPI